MLVTIKLFPASIKLNLKSSKIIGSLCPTRVISPTSRFYEGFIIQILTDILCVMYLSIQHRS